MADRYRIVEKRDHYADGWLRWLDKFNGDADAFVWCVMVENRGFYAPAPEPRDPVMIPKASVTQEVQIGNRRFSLTVCRVPQLFLLEELR